MKCRLKHNSERVGTYRMQWLACAYLLGLGDTCMSLRRQRGSPRPLNDRTTPLGMAAIHGIFVLKVENLSLVCSKPGPATAKVNGSHNLVLLPVMLQYQGRALYEEAHLRQPLMDKHFRHPLITAHHSH